MNPNQMEDRTMKRSITNSVDAKVFGSRIIDLSPSPKMPWKWWAGCCPAKGCPSLSDTRDDRSLQFRDSSGGLLVKCDEGCTVEAILDGWEATTYRRSR